MRRQQSLLPVLLFTILPGISLAGLVPDSQLAIREQQYQDVVCRPSTNSASDQVPPCTEIENIEILCTPNGTAPIYLAAHSQCMCGGSFFQEWLACQRCLFVHGIRNERQMALYNNIITSASNALCTGTPTADFKTLFASIEGAATSVTTGAEGLSDQFPSRTEISLYYTASGTQGPGRITGEAATATNTRGLMTAEPTKPLTNGVTNGSGTRITSLGLPSSSTSMTSPNGALPTNPHGGLVMAVAGMAIVAAL
jgi:hypothetical protein